jgi:formylglycine-generating enzyme required for sulfatase activity
VAEWVADIFYKKYYKVGRDRFKNPKGPTRSMIRNDFKPQPVVRGGSWKSDKPAFLTTFRCASTEYRTRIDRIGFRCAKSP